MQQSVESIHIADEDLPNDDDDDDFEGDFEEDPLCDYERDSKDEAWVNDYLMLGYTPSSRPSDATLNCPCCFTLLCLDCQQHDYYSNQFRAMFVKNCVVDFDRWFVYMPNSHSSPLTETSPPSHTATDEERSGYYHKVKCNICTTEVAVIDADEVFHFYNVFPSEPPVCTARDEENKRERKRERGQGKGQKRLRSIGEEEVVDGEVVVKKMRVDEGDGEEKCIVVL
jgi:hypothetical protein